MTGYPREVRREWLVDAAIAAVLGAACIVGVVSELSSAGRFRQDWPGALTIAAAAAVPLLWRRRHPGLVATSAVLIVAAYHFAGYPGFAPALVLFAVVYALAAYGRGPRALVGCVAIAVSVWFVPTLPPHRVDPASMAIVAPALSLGWMLMLGASARQRRLAIQGRLDAAAAQAEAAAVEAQTELGRRLAEERLRIARDLHDVLAHTIAVISVQAGVVADTLDDDPRAARAALDRVRESARAAMPQLRAAVEPLRSSTVGVRGGLADIAALIDDVRSAGLAVECTSATPALAPEVELTVYRVVQEALTNVVRHAHASRVTVTITSPDDRTVTVDVCDDGAGSAETGSGFGLVGMRERVHALGGVLEAGPVAGVGFRVHASIPRAAP
jgi:signal transduction histidine kinase